MYKKLDDFFCRYVEIAENGQSILGASISSVGEAIYKVVLSILAILIMLVLSPVWLIGKFSAEHHVQADATPPTDSNSSDQSA